MAIDDTYVTRAQMERELSFIQSQEDLLSEEVLNRTHRLVANNLDLIVPSIEYLAVKFGEDCITTRIRDYIPKYSNSDIGYRPYNIKDGMSFKEAIIALDRAAKELRAFIISKTKFPANINPFLSPTGMVVPGLGTADNAWILSPDESGITSAIADVPPVNRTGMQGPCIYPVSYENPQHLLALDCRRAGRGQGYVQLYQSFDGGIKWNLLSTSEFSGYGSYSWAYLVRGSAAYKDSTGIIQIGYGMSHGTHPHLRYYGTAVYDRAAQRWATTITATGAWTTEYCQLVLRRSLSNSRVCLAAWVNASQTYLRVRHATTEYSKWATDNPAVGSILIKNPVTNTVYWTYIGHPDIVHLGSGHIVVVFSAKATATDRFNIWACYSDDDGVTYSDPEVIVGGTQYSYISPSMVYLVNGGLGLVFATNEEKSYQAPNVVKVAVSYDMGRTWYNKVKVYEGSTYFAPGAIQLTTKVFQVSNGSILCFIENPVSYYDRRLVRVRLRIEV